MAKRLDPRKILEKALPQEYMADKTLYELTFTGLQIEALFGLLKAPRVVIHLDGGLVKWVFCDQPGGSYKVLDFDTEGAEPDEVQKIGLAELLITQNDKTTCDRRYVEKVFQTKSKYLAE